MPEAVLACTVELVAMPSEPVTAVVVVVLDPVKVPDAPLAGRVNVTVTPDTTLPKVSVTLAFKALVKSVPIPVVWPDPPSIPTRAGAAAVLVRENAVGRLGVELLTFAVML